MLLSFIFFIFVFCTLFVVAVINPGDYRLCVGIPNVESSIYVISLIPSFQILEMAFEENVMGVDCFIVCDSYFRA